MAGSDRGAQAAAWNPWRIARWIAALALLLTPLWMMQISSGWHWTFGSFVFAGAMIGGVALLYDFVERASDSRAFRTGVGVAIVASFLTVWTTLVRDDGSGIDYFMLIMTILTGGFACLFSSAGMARTMLGVAIMQALFGVAIATAPSTASIPDGSFRALLFNGFFAALWLISATFFRAAAKRDYGARRGEAGT